MEKVLKFRTIAEAAANFSLDRGTKVGAVALDENMNVLCIGYNGFPRGVVHKEDRFDRPLKYKYTAHAEENLVAQAAYTGTSLKGATVIVTSLFPCTTCTRLLIQAGVKRVISCYRVQSTNPDWEAEMDISNNMFREAGVKIEIYD